MLEHFGFQIKRGNQKVLSVYYDVWNKLIRTTNFHLEIIKNVNHTEIKSSQILSKSKTKYIYILITVVSVKL